MSMLKEAFEAGKFGVTAEMAPPKGYDFSEQLEAAKLLNGKVHGVNVTDMQSASLKASSLGLCVALKNAGIVKNPKDGIKVLGDGAMTKKLTVKAAKFSKTAVEKIEANGGKAEVI